MTRTHQHAPTQGADEHDAKRRPPLHVPAETAEPPGDVQPEPLDGGNAADRIALLNRLTITRFSGQVTAATHLATMLETDLMRSAGTAEEGPAAPRLWLEVGSTYLLKGRTLAALRCLGKARQLAAAGTGDHVERESLAMAAVALALRGSISSAVDMIRRLGSLPDASSAVSGRAVAAERIARAMVTVERGGDELASMVSQLDPVNGQGELWPFDLLVRVRFELLQGDPAQALEHVQLATASHPFEQGSVADDIRRSSMVDALLLLGELPRARSVIDEGPCLLLTRVARVRYLLHSGDPTTAFHEFRQFGAAADLPVAARSELLLTRCWTDVLLDGVVGQGNADSAVRLILGGQSRRALTTVPRSVLDAVLAGSDPADAENCRRAVAGLRFATSARTLPQLTPGELTLLRVIDERRTVAELARMLKLSPNTVKTHLRSIYRKLGTSDRTGVLTAAARRGLIAAPTLGSPENGATDVDEGLSRMLSP